MEGGIEAIVVSELDAILCLFFFFQAEDGIRDYKVTGVQTCALPIFGEVVALGMETVGLLQLRDMDCYPAQYHESICPSLFQCRMPLCGATGERLLRIALWDSVDTVRITKKPQRVFKQIHLSSLCGLMSSKFSYTNRHQCKVFPIRRRKTTGGTP